jgi:hypothetical protein
MFRFRIAKNLHEFGVGTSDLSVVASCLGASRTSKLIPIIDRRP